MRTKIATVVLLVLSLFVNSHAIANVMTMTFEEFLGQDGTSIGTFYPSVRFEALTGGGEDWIVSDVTTDQYNASSWPSGQSWQNGQYWIYDYVGAWTGQPGAGGKIVFDQGMRFVEIGYCCATQLTLTAYNLNNDEIDSAVGPANLRYANGNDSGPGTVRVEAPSGQLISYVTIHDSGNYWIVDNITVETALELNKYDDVEDCTSPGETITYTICFNNLGGITLEDAYIVDTLPVGVTYPEGDYSFGFDPNASPPIILYPPDPGYLPSEHAYVWLLDDIDPNESDCLELSVVVNEAAAPGTYLHNVAELWGTVYVLDPNDPNSVVPAVRLIAHATVDTRVCCYITPPQTLFVDETAVNGAQTGVDWANAFVSLQDALAFARSALCGEVESIYVAQGTYSPGDSEDDTFDLTSLPGISLYGGFKSGGCSWEARSPEKSKTILSGRIDETHRTDTIVTMGDNTLLSGFTIADAGVHGVYGNGVDIAVVDCTIENSWEYGLRAIGGNTELRRCYVLNSQYDGVRHDGAGYTLSLENCWIKKSGRRGVWCTDSTPVIVNSVCSESDLNEAGNEGILMLNPTYSPLLQNVTVSHNKAAGLSLVGAALPELQNCIVYHNGGPSLVGFSADNTAAYSCIQDCNSVNENINTDPEFAYYDPNNMRLSLASPCRDSGNPYLDYQNQLEMDKKDRVYGTAVDRGAYELTCEDVSNTFDWNADGIVNFHEFGRFAAVWRAHDPNDPAILDPQHPDHAYLIDPNSPGYVSEEAMALWHPGYEYNFSATGSSEYAIDVADLAVFVEEAPWLWMACWLLEGGSSQMMSGGDSMLLGGFEAQAVSEPSALEQLGDLVNIVGQLETIWLDDPNIQQEIDSTDWQEFMDALYDNLLEVYLSTQ